APGRRRGPGAVACRCRAIPAPRVPRRRPRPPGPGAPGCARARMGCPAPGTIGGAVAVEGAPGAGHGETDIGGAATGDRTEHRTVRWIDDLEPLAVERCARSVVDEETALDDSGTIGWHGGARAVSLACAVCCWCDAPCTLSSVTRVPAPAE